MRIFLFIKNNNMTCIKYLLYDSQCTKSCRSIAWSFHKNYLGELKNNEGR